MLKKIFVLLRLVPALPFVASTGLGFGGVLCNLLLMGTAGYLIASASLQPPLYTLTLAVTLVRAVGLGRAVCRYGERYLSHSAAFRAMGAVKGYIYRQAAAKIPLQEGVVAQEKYLHALNASAETIRDVYVRAFAPITINFAVAFLGVLCLLPIIDVAAFWLLPLVVLHIALPAYFSHKDSQRETVAAESYLGRILDLHAGKDELRHVAALDRTLVLAKEEYVNLQAIKARVASTGRWVSTFLTICRYLLLVGFAWLLFWQVGEKLTAVELVVAVLTLEAMLGELGGLSAAGQELSKLWAALKNIKLDESGEELVDVKSADGESELRQSEILPLTEDAENAHQNTSRGQDKEQLIAAKNLTFSYPCSQQLFAPLNFTLTQGEHTAIIGESGRGKTTLSYLLLGLWQGKGSLAYRGLPYNRLSLEEILRNFSPAVQGEYVFNQSTREIFHLLLPECSEEDILHALKIVGLDQRIKNFPDGINTPLGENAAKLSGGERSRFLIALAVTKHAPILLLDEPTMGLDAVSAQRLLQNLLTSDKTMLVITHDLPVIQSMSNVIELSHACT